MIVPGIVAVVCALAVVWLIGSRLCAPSQKPVLLPDHVTARRVTARSESGATLHGWVVDTETPRAVVVLLHGVRSTRLSLLARAQFLAAAGYAVVLFDFQAHGESSGRQITFGFLESRDAIAVVNFARGQYPGKAIGVIGVSMGGAAAVLAGTGLEADAVVLESVYPTIEEAVQDRIEMVGGAYARWLAPLLTCQLKPRIGCTAAQLRPIERVSELRMAKLFIAGDQDRHTRIAESRALFARAADPREYWEVPGAAHVDIHEYCPAEYERRILEFFARNLT